MKTIQKTKLYDKSVSHVRLYREDLDIIVSIIDSTKISFTVHDDHFEYDSLDEFAKHKGISPQKLSFETEHTTDGHLSVSYSNNLWEIRAYGVTPILKAIDIADILERRKTGITQPLFSAIGVTSTLLMYYALASLPAAVDRGRTSELLMLAVLYSSLTGITISAFSLMYLSIIYPRTFLVHRHSSGFIRKNRESILLSVISAIIGSLATYLFSVLTSK